MDINVITKPTTNNDIATIPPQSRHFTCDALNSFIAKLNAANEAIKPMTKETKAITPKGVEITLTILSKDKTIWAIGAIKRSKDGNIGLFFLKNSTQHVDFLRIKEPIMPIIGTIIAVIIKPKKRKTVQPVAHFMDRDKPDIDMNIAATGNMKPNINIRKVIANIGKLILFLTLKNVRYHCKPGATKINTNGTQINKKLFPIMLWIIWN